MNESFSYQEIRSISVTICCTGTHHFCVPRKGENNKILLDSSLRAGHPAPQRTEEHFIMRIIMGSADKRILIAASSCIGILLIFTPSAMADRDVGDQGNYFQRLRNKGAAGRRGKRSRGFVSDRYDVEAASSRIRLRPKIRTGSSIFTRSFFLAAILCTARFVLPRMKGWIRKCCRGISEIKRYMESRPAQARPIRSRKKTKSRQDEGGDAQTISPSVMDIIDLGEDSDNDGSSFISAISSASTFLSFSRMRKRKSWTSFALLSETADTTKRLSESSAGRNKRPLSNSLSTMPISNASRWSNQPSGMDKERTNNDGALPNESHNNLGRLMHFIEEDNHAAAADTMSAAKPRRPGPVRRATESSDDASRIPASAAYCRGGRGFDMNGPLDLHPNSPLERKLSAGSPRGPKRARGDDGNSA